MQLSPKRDHRGLVLHRKAREVLLDLERPDQRGRLVGGHPHLRLLGAELSDPSEGPRALRPQGGLDSEPGLHLQLAEPLLLPGERGQPPLRRFDLGLEAPGLGDRNPQRASGPALRAHPLERFAESLHRLGGGGPLGAGVDQSLECLAEPPRLLRSRLRGGEEQTLLAQPGGGAEDGLVDPQVKAARAHRAARPELLGDVTPAQLLDLGVHPVAVEALGHPEALAAIQPVGEGQAEAPRRPGEPAGPVAALPGPALPARIQAVEGGADGPVQRRLA